MKKCKLCKRLDDKFLIKGGRCGSAKCSAIKKTSSYKRKKPLSEYGFQLNEKQKMKILYSLRERQFKKYVMEATNKKKEDASEYLMRALETRLDNVVYRAGIADSRDAARQIVSHGHVLLNKKGVNIPSQRIKAGDKIIIKDSSKKKKLFENLDTALKKYNPPSWIKLDKTEKEIEIIGIPSSEDNEFKINTTSIIEFYSK